MLRLMAIALLLSLSGVRAETQWVVQNPYWVEAAFLRHFAHYVEWPGEAFSESGWTWNVGVLGPDPFGEILENSFQGRVEQGRSFAVYRAERLEALPRCQILFIAIQDEEQRRAVLRALRDRPVLTVGEAKDFLQEGGVIRFLVSDRVNISVNLDQAKRVMLTIQTKMLEVSSEILEHGRLRPARQK